MLRIIKESKPAWVIGENVTGIINMELDTVLSDLEGEGFEAIPFVIPACGINAWHRRNRVWILGFSRANWDAAHSGLQRQEKCEEQATGIEQCDKETGERVTADSTGGKHGQHKTKQKGRSKIDGYNTVSTNTAGRRGRRVRNESKAERSQDGNELSGISGGFYRNTGDIADNEGIRLQGFGSAWEQISKTHGGKGLFVRSSSITDIRETEPDMDGMVHGISEGLDEDIGSIWAAEPNVPRVVQSEPGRVDRLKGLGNAIVPEIAYIFFMMILQIESQMDQITGLKTN